MKPSSQAILETFKFPVPGSKEKITSAGKISVTYKSGSKSEGRFTDKKGHSEQGGHGDGTWIFSYADMITILMMFFILLLSISNMSSEKFDELKQAMKPSDVKIKEGEKNPSEISKSVVIPEELKKYLTEGGPQLGGVPLEAIAAKAQSTAGDRFSQLTAGVRMLMASVNQKFIEKEQIKILEFSRLKDQFEKMAKVVDGRAQGVARGNEIHITLSSDEFFLNDTATLKPSAKKLMKELFNSVELIEPHPMLHIESYASSHYKKSNNVYAMRTKAESFSLTNNQINAVFSLLLDSGADPSVISMAAYGANRPFASEKNSFNQLDFNAINANNRIMLAIIRRQDEFNPGNSTQGVKK